jgi:hypothetical protein
MGDGRHQRDGSGLIGPSHRSDGARAVPGKRTQAGPPPASAPGGVGKRTLVEGLPPARASIQAKLQVSAAGDGAEQEADAIGHQLVSAIAAPQAAAIPRPTAAVREAASPASTPVLREAAVAGAGSEAQPGPLDVEQRIVRLRGGGSVLPDELATHMGSGLGADLRDVRVHVDSEADALATELGARAFTSGRDIFFRRGEYDPGSKPGQELIAHELTHVVQQGASGHDTQVQRAPTDTTGIQGPGRAALRAAWAHYRIADSRIAQIVARVESMQNVTLVVTSNPLPNGQAPQGNTRVEIASNGGWVAPQHALQNGLNVGTPSNAQFRIIIYVDPGLTEGVAISTYIHEMLLHAEDFAKTIDEFRECRDVGDALFHWQRYADFGERSPQRQHNAVRSDHEDYEGPRGQRYCAMHRDVTSRLDTSMHQQQNVGNQGEAIWHQLVANDVNAAMAADINVHTQNPLL